jgi:hypothetical protein
VLLTGHGRIDEAVEILQARADAGHRFAAARLVEVLAEQGRLDGLRARADGGDRSAADRLVKLLAEQRRVDELIGEVAAGTPTAAGALQQIADQRDAPSPSPPV